VGVEDERWGETGVAFVVIRPGLATDVEDLREHCASQLAPFKVPTRIEMVSSLPRTALNKVLRARLRSELTGDQGARPRPAAQRPAGTSAGTASGTAAGSTAGARAGTTAGARAGSTTGKGDRA
jgi:fatty-acyl-CoA synthase